MLEEIYTHIIVSNFEMKYIKAYTINDIKLDSKHSFINFKEFYDAFFELIDGNTCSSLIIEYCRLVKTIHTFIEDA